MQRENLAKMPDAEPDAGMAEKHALAMFDKKNPVHRETSHPLREILPDILVPESWFAEAPATAA